MQLADLPAHYVHSKLSDAVPLNALLPNLIPQMQPHQVLAGKDAVFKVQLSQFQDGSVLGISYSHAVAGDTCMLLLNPEFCVA